MIDCVWVHFLTFSPKMAANPNSQKFHIKSFCVPAQATELPAYVCDPCSTNRVMYLATDGDVERHCIGVRHINSTEVGRSVSC